MIVIRLAFVVVLLHSCKGYAQVAKKIREYERTFQFSLFPGISTNGISSASYINSYSFNLFGGLSAANRVLEIGLVTNNNLKTTTGIQIAGLANITGANSFVNLSQSEERAMINGEDFEVNRTGIQVAGILNYVLNNGKGIMLSGGLNVAGNNFRGFQLGGIGNSAGDATIGLQLAGFYNVTGESTAGFQISSLFNFTGAQLSGVQIAAVNKAGWIKGKKSTPPTATRGMQIGLLNFSKAMDCWQIGLINFGGAARGKQIGLINFFEKYGSKENVRMGTPIGLLNFGSRGSSVRVFYNELYPMNIEVTTGNCLNCTWLLNSEMPYDDNNQIYNQNALIVGYDYALETWGFGYGFQKVLYNKASIMPSPDNKKRVISYGVKAMHLNRSLSFDKTFNLLTRLNADIGKRFGFLYVFAGISVNYFLYEGTERVDVYKIRSVTYQVSGIRDWDAMFWPGYAVGFQYNL